MCIVKPENSKGNNFAESKIVRDDNRWQGVTGVTWVAYFIYLFFLIEYS